MRAIRGVVLDFYGTLVRMVPPLPPSHQAIFNRRGLAAAGERWGDQWSVGPGEGEEHLAHSGSERAYLAWERNRLSARARGCGVPGDQLEELVIELDRAMKDIHLALFDDVREVLTALRAEGVLIAVCSNWYWARRGRTPTRRCPRLIDVTVSSAEAGARKPHPLIYRTVLRRSALAPGETLFVGDVWRPDVLGPLAAGMRAVHLWRPDRAVETAAPPLVPGASRIAGLRELIPLVRSERSAGPTHSG